MRLPVYTIPQFRSTWPVDTVPLAHAMLINALPVNNSAPPTTTKTSPRQNTIPASRRARPKGNTPAVPALTVVEKMAPRAINAPARMARVRSDQKGRQHFRAPTSSARFAISGGSSLSIVTGPIGSDIVDLDIILGP